MIFPAKTTLTLLLSLASYAAAGWSTGVAPGANPGAVRSKAINDPSYIDDNNFQESMVNAHNGWRREHGVSSMSWDPELAKYAELVSKTCEFKHSVSGIVDFYVLLILRRCCRGMGLSGADDILWIQGGPYGENICAGYDTAQDSVDTWGLERNLYRSLDYYNRPNPPQGSLHFTQVVWASSYFVGCARTKCSGIIARENESWYYSPN